MNHIGTILQQGFTAAQALQYLSKYDKKLAKMVSKALKEGFSPEEVVSGLSGKSFAAKKARPRGFSAEEVIDRNQQKPGTAQQGLKQIGTAAAIAGGLLGAGRAAAPIASFVGNYVSSNLGGGPTQPQAPTGLNAGGGQLPNIPQTGNAPTGAPTPSGGPQGGGIGGLLKSLVPAVAGLFGFKNKPLVTAISKIVEETGQDVQQVYNQLSENYDISTPEKATAAAKTFFDKIMSPTGKTEEEEQDIFKRFSKVEGKEKKVEPAESAVIRRTEYLPDEKKLVVVFNKGSVYEYENVPEDKYKELLASATPAKTEGQNEYGAWWVGKNPSLGATFNSLIKNGGYVYNKVAQGAAFNPESSSEEENQILSSSNLRSLVQKTQKATGEEKFVGKQKKPLTSEQIRNRRLLLEKSLQEAKGKSRQEKNSELSKTVDERLKSLEKLDKLRGSKKSKVLTEEIIRSEKANGKTLIKKMLVLLPASIVKVLKKKMESSSEQEILGLIKDYLKSQK